MQEIVIEKEFEKTQCEFLDKYCNEFEEKVENKLIYTDIFKQYTKLTEKYLEQKLIEKLPQYKIDDFYKLLEKRKHQIDDQLLDILISFTDFQAFKEMILDYKKSKTQHSNLCDGVSISKFDSTNKHQFDFDLEILILFTFFI